MKRPITLVSVVDGSTLLVDAANLTYARTNIGGGANITLKHGPTFQVADTVEEIRDKIFEAYGVGQ